MTLPLTDPVNLNAWINDLHMYPKNAIARATETVTDAADVKLGDEIEFTVLVITAKVNTIGEIANSAVLYPSAASFTIAPGDTDGPTTSAQESSREAVVALVGRRQADRVEVSVRDAGDGELLDLHAVASQLLGESLT